MAVLCTEVLDPSLKSQSWKGPLWEVWLPENIRVTSGIYPLIKGHVPIQWNLFVPSLTWHAQVSSFNIFFEWSSWKIEKQCPNIQYSGFTIERSRNLWPVRMNEVGRIHRHISGGSIQGRLHWCSTRSYWNLNSKNKKVRFESESLVIWGGCDGKCK